MGSNPTLSATYVMYVFVIVDICAVGDLMVPRLAPNEGWTGD